ncbi:hypothetical protein CVT24_008429 [Panaeolus cyanescens]|uniref:Uncharacterized protein n=1 Tax=Panaeolus cyanescens TaxID=181874 RepID=A0A409VEH1_9AGAR|nr:hypothetical protein CVT24_008429 [Panaeolus cyanescens]
MSRIKAEREKREREEVEREKKAIERRERERKEREERERKEREEREENKEEGEIVEDDGKEKEKEKEKDEKKEKEKEEDVVVEKTVTFKEKESGAVNAPSPPKKVEDKQSPIVPIHAPPTLPNPVMDEPQPQPMLDIETRTTIIIPSTFIPTEKPHRPRLWGGGGFDPRPRPPPPVARSRKSKGKKAGRGQPSPGLLPQQSGLVPPSLNELTKSSRSHTRNRRPRRVYTDDSDIFLCAIHSGWLTWSGARRARARGLDVRIDVRVLRCAGAGAANVFARGLGVLGANTESPGVVKEEIVGRFVGGYGERCFNPLGKTGKTVKEDEEDDDDDDLENADKIDDVDDDGRGLVSAGWGTGHDGSAIEIIGVEFVERSTGHAASGLGRRNRSQRMLEYAERRASILGVSSAPSASSQCASPTARLAGRKRRRGQWDAWPVQPRRLPNASVLDVIQEVHDEEDEEEDRHVPKRLRTSKDEDRLMDVRTMVFGMGATGDLCVGYKYLPSMLEELLFPSPRPTPSETRKRRRPTDDTDVEMADADSPYNGLASEETAEPPRPIILETAKERYLLSPSVLPKPSTPTSAVSSQQGANKQPILYDIGLVLEAEVVVEEETVPIDTSGPASAITGSEQPESAIEKTGGESRTEREKEIETAEDIVMSNSEVGDDVAAPTKAEDSLATTTEIDKDSGKPTSPDDDSVGITVSVQPGSPARANDETSDAKLKAEDTAQPSQEQEAAIPGRPASPSRHPPLEPLPTSPLALSETNAQSNLTTPSLRLIPKPFAPTPLPTVPPPHLSAHSRHRHTFSTATVVLIDEETGLEIEPAKPQFAVQMLQTNLTKGMFRFADDGVYVRDDVVMMNGAEGSGEEVPSEWVIQVKNWKWAPKNARAVIN